VTEVVEKAMKKRISNLTLTRTLTLALTLAASSAALGLESLRSAEELVGPSVEPMKYKVEVVQGGFDRSFKEQPPMIPHGIDKYSVDLRQNGCLKCHSEATAAKENTKPAPESHYLDRDGNKLDKLSSRRYFCSQCHTVQVEGEPLVENTFEGRK
jgi:nitrate reductase (cytochrome), electron transfer subunit